MKKQVYEENQIFEKIFIKWYESDLETKPTSQLSLKDCYELYTIRLTQDWGVIPASKRRFSSFLKKNLQKLIHEGKVRIYTQSGIHIQGIQVKSPPILKT